MSETRQEERRKHGRHVTNKGATSGLVRYLLDKRSRMAFLGSGLLLASGEEATIDIILVDEDGTEIRADDAEAALEAHLLTSDSGVLEVVTSQPQRIKFQSMNNGVPEVRARSTVRARSSGSASLTISGTTSSAALGLVESGTVAATVT